MIFYYTLCCTFVWQHTNNSTIQSHLPENVIVPIKFKRFDSSSVDCYSFSDVSYQGPRILGAQETITDVPVAKLLSDRITSTMLISEVLSRLELPQSDQPATVDRIFTLLESAKTMLPIYVTIMREAFRVVEIGLRYQEHDEIERVTRESMDAYEVKSIPAAKAIIDGLERVRVKLEDVKESWSCVICMEGFEDGVEAIRLPCMHVFHEKCCVKWLMTNQLCPLCRYQLPSEQDLLADS